MLKLERTYILALSIIAITISISQFISQKYILTTKVDSRIVNISGRQRMLSQKISKAAIEVINTNDTLIFYKSRIELLNAVNQWSKSHHALQFGNVELGINTINNSETILHLFKALNIPFKTISEAAIDIANNITLANKREKKWQNNLNQILTFEDSFLTIMDDITYQYDEEAKQKMNKLSNLEYCLYALSILLLLTEALSIFKPAIKKLKLSTQQLIEKEKQLEHARVERQYLDQLKAKNKELEQFTYITSHDLQEPLNTIISFANLLQESNNKLDKIGNKSLEVIVRLSYRMKNFISSLLEYSRIGIEKERSSVNIKKTIDNLMLDLHSLIQKENATINYIGPNLTIKAYENDLIKLFQNLIVNAIKYQNKDTLPVIIINAQEHVNEYLFSIEDNGIGIEKEYYEKIFEVFQRLHTRDKFEGTGIGLSYCKKIVEIHKGKIWLESQVGKGTIFYFTIAKN